MKIIIKKTVEIMNDRYNAKHEIWFFRGEHIQTKPFGKLCYFSHIYLDLTTTDISKFAACFNHPFSILDTQLRNCDTRSRKPHFYFVPLTYWLIEWSISLYVSHWHRVKNTKLHQPEKFRKRWLNNTLIYVFLYI